MAIKGNPCSPPSASSSSTACCSSTGMLCYSTGSLPDGIPLRKIADILTATPFTGVELVVTADMLPRAGDFRHWEGVRDEFQSRGLAFRNVHLGAPHLMGPEPHRPGLSSLEP